MPFNIINKFSASDVIMKYNIGHLKDSLNNLSESTSVKSPEKISKGKHFDKKVSH